MTSNVGQGTRPDAPSRLQLRREHIPLLVLMAGVAVGLTELGPRVWLILLTDGLFPAAVILAACGWGSWPTVWLVLGRRPVLQQLCVASGLGLGVLGVSTLALGLAGWLSRPTAWALVGAGWFLGLARVYVLQKPSSPPEPGSLVASGRSSGWAWLAVSSVLLLTLAVPLSITIFGASLPPKVLWMGENFAYDVLEYHLEAPREYFDAGRIHFLPHNVYASFPQQMEMLYLLLMHLAGTPLAGAIPAQLLHVLCGVLTVIALVAWTPPGMPRVVVAVVAGSLPWLAYLGCLAYVELGTLLLAAVAGGLLLDHFRDGAACGWRGTLAAGLCAGLAGGCKYTALAMVAAALGLAWFGTLRATLATRAKQLGVFGAGALVAFSPWLIRNAACTGNPIYPFGYRWLGGTAWSVEQDAQWVRGHRVPAEKAALSGRLAIVRDELFTAELFVGARFAPRGCLPAVFILGLAGLIRARSRAAALLVLWFVLVVLIWATLTHMPGRFVVPALIPLALLSGLAVTPRTRSTDVSRAWAPGFSVRAATALLTCIGILSALANNVTLTTLLHKHDAWWGKLGLPLRDLVGATDAMAGFDPLNQIGPGDRMLWLVGESRAFYLRPRVHCTVVFDRDPWLETARTATPEQTVAWLRTQKVSHVVFSWNEIDRLKKTYGFPEFVQRGWAESLCSAGLRRVVLPDEVLGPDVDAYEVLPR